MNLAGKKYLIIGVANDRSIAWGIAKGLRAAGADLAFTYLNEALEKRVRPLAESIDSHLVLPCDVQSDEQLRGLAGRIQSEWGSLDGIVHAVAYADKEDLQGRASKISRKGFSLALDISAYSLIAVAGAFEELLKPAQGSILTLSYLGAERAIPNYSIMGIAKAALEASVRYLAADLGQHNIRVNAISAGPIKTLAALGIPHFKDLLSEFAQRAAIKRNVTLEDVAGPAVFLLSPSSAGITGEVMYVDCGFSIMGV